MALLGLGAVVLIVVAITAPPGAPLRDPETGNIIGQTPFMDSLLFIIMLAFLVSGICYGIGARTMKGSADVIKAITKTFAGLGGMVLMLLMISQFIAYFNYTNMATLAAVSLARILQQMNLDALWLLIGFVVVVFILDLIITAAIAKWAIFAPVFVPLLMKLGVEPEAVLAAYRVGDSPMNAITPLNAYFALVVGFAQKYDRTAGVGTIVSLMLPYVVWMFVLWTALFALWKVLGLPWGL